MLVSHIDYTELVLHYTMHASKGWSASTQVTAISKLRQAAKFLNKYGLEADKVYSAMQSSGYSAYTIKTMFTHIRGLMDYALHIGVYSGVNPFEIFVKVVAPNKFKTANVYKPKEVSLDWDAAVSAISSAAIDMDTKETCLYLLKTGLRISELYKIERDPVKSEKWFVKGKGGKIRPVLFAPPDGVILAPHTSVQAALKEIGLTPHQLRKLTATRLAECGNIEVHELQQIMGWSSIATASIYIQRAKFDKLSDKLKGVL